jgi:general secretion pathway protein A
VLVGQPELDLKLSRPSLRQVTERVAVRCHINPLTQSESIRYLEHRLRVAGGSTALFTPAALRSSRGRRAAFRGG